ncbi:MAG: hypothetical protein Q9227_001309 [Pyrenula ochraceoflavens]
MDFDQDRKTIARNRLTKANHYDNTTSKDSKTTGNSFRLTLSISFPLSSPNTPPMYVHALNVTLNNTLLANGTHNATISNSTLPADLACHLSPHARALSTVLTAFVGAVITGISCGISTTFLTGWISWLPALRIDLVALFALFQVCIFGQYVGWEDEGYSAQDAFDDSVTVMWTIGNWEKASGELKIVRALGIAVAALPLTLDTKARYGHTIAKRCGCLKGVVRFLFNLITALALCALSAASTALLIKAAIELQLPWSAIFGYTLFTVIWAVCSYVSGRPTDAAESNDTILKKIGGFFMGCFVGIFVATPAYIVLRTAANSPGVDLQTYLRCESVALWQKFIAIFP